jgi:divinyl chlorophyllide a 8-vinyl-reductase
MNNQECRAKGVFGKQRKSTLKTLAQALSPSTQDYRRKQPKDINVLVVGPTGYIGKFVTKELIQRGFNVIAVAREKAGIGGKQSQDQTKAEFSGGDVRFGNATEAESLERAVNGDRIDVVVSCLASRTGGKKDSWLIDYQATKNSLDVGRAHGAQHFVLLSAICVQKPLLEFQKAKLKFETELQNTEGLTWSIVRPTAFFKSLGGQVGAHSDRAYTGRSVC